MPLAPQPTSARGRKIALNVVLGAAIVDGVFLVGLVIALLAGAGGAVKILAPLYVFGFVYLLYLAATGAMRGTFSWGWRYLALVALTLGPAGAIYGARRMRAEADAQIAAERRPTRKQERRAATERRRGSPDRR